MVAIGWLLVLVDPCLLMVLVDKLIPVTFLDSNEEPTSNQQVQPTVAKHNQQMTNNRLVGPVVVASRFTMINQTGFGQLSLGACLMRYHGQL